MAHYGIDPYCADRNERDDCRGTVSGAIVDRQTIHIPDVLAEAERFPDNSHIRDRVVFEPTLRRRCCGKGHLSGDRHPPHGSSALYRQAGGAAGDLCLQAVIAIENVRLFKEFRSATQNCAKPWSIRRQRPRCSASSAARPRTCSRYSTPSSRAQPGSVGLMM